MTREEAIKNLQEIIEEGWLISGFDKCTAIDACEMAIKALQQEPCEDAISRQAVLDAMYNLCGEGALENNPWRDNPHIDAIVDAILDLSSVTSQPKTGHWFLSGGYWRCSECKEKALLKLDKVGVGCREYIPIKSNYCPNCGRKMMQEVEE